MTPKRTANIADSAAAPKNASIALGAPDQLDREQGNNKLFGENGTPAHADAALAGYPGVTGADEAADNAADPKKAGEPSVSVAQLLATYTPLY